MSKTEHLIFLLLFLSLCFGLAFGLSVRWYYIDIDSQTAVYLQFAMITSFALAVILYTIYRIRGGKL